MYQYLPIEQAKPGDIVEYVGTSSNAWAKPGTIGIVTDFGYQAPNSLGIADDASDDNVWDIVATYNDELLWKLIKTKPGTEAKVGDTVMCIEISGNRGDRSPIVGEVYTIDDTNPTQLSPDEDKYWQKHCFKVLCKGEPLLHQEWKDLHDSGVELECNYTYPNSIQYGKWFDVVSKPSAQSFNDPGYSYRNKHVKPPIKEPEMQITDYIIDIKGSSLQDRLRLRQVLLDNGQALGTADVFTSKSNVHKVPQANVALGPLQYTREENFNISLTDFITKFKKHDQVRNLAFTTDADFWSMDQMETICEFVGDSGDDLWELDSEDAYFYDSKSSSASDAFMGTSHTSPKNHLQVTYEDVFPQAMEEPEPAKDQPMDKPLLSDLLKQHGAYEKFLANLSVSHYHYQLYLGQTMALTCMERAFVWENSPEGENYWMNMFNDTDCINDVRAPDDFDYWEEQFQAGKDVWVRRSAQNGGTKCEGLSPKQWSNLAGCYAENPTWLKPPTDIPDLSEESVITEPGTYTTTFGSALHTNLLKEATMPFEEGDIVRSLTYCSEDSRMTGTIHKIKPLLSGAGLGYECIDGDICTTTDWDNFELVSKASDAATEKPMAKVGDRVIDYNGRIETVTKVDGTKIWVSNTNSGSWILGMTWKLYKGDDKSTTETSETTAPKEQIMNNNVNIELKVNGKEVCTGAKVAKVKSDYKIRPAVIADYYSTDGEFLSTERFTGKSAMADAQAHLVTMLAAHPNAKVVPYTMGKTSKIKHQFEVVSK